jgi:2-polyprenyl-3-methyl-5-hydroxy-6-metoxy-1,4-benzoquinol methylase
MNLTDADMQRVDEFAGQLFMAALGAMELSNIELGVRLGLYEELAGASPLTAPEFAERAGIAPRYAREWLEQQAASSVLEVDDASAGPDQRRYTLPAAHAHVLTEDDSEACGKPLAAIVPWAGHGIEIMQTMFRSGAGASFGDFDLHDLQAAFTRPVFVNHLTQNWLPAVPGLQSRLESGEHVRIAEVGCGEGLAGILIGRAYPNAEVDGYDLDQASITAAREAAAAAGVADRVRFHCRDAADLDIAGSYDLVLAIEMLHDVPDPVGVLRTMRRLAGEIGLVVVADERTEDSFTAPASEMERFFYAFSTLHCLAVSLQDGGVGTGTVIRQDTVREYATQAGFSTVTDLGVEHPQFRLYHLTP